MIPQQLQPETQDDNKRILQAYRQEQRNDWGEVDDDTLIRFLSGKATHEEVLFVQKQIEKHPSLKEQVEFMQGIF
jgi:hypothetical protein